MAIELIDIGSSPNDNTGDPIRTAFTKINDNFLQASLKTATIVTSSSTSRTLISTDAGAIVNMTNDSPNTVFIPADSTYDFPIGTIIIVLRGGLDTTTITAASGVTANGISEFSCIITDRYFGATLIKVAANTWYINGSITAV